MSFVSYAQNFEDVMLWRALRNVGTGFYIDVGAHDPNQDSVTRAFYERGWHGINIDPLESCYERLKLNRPDDINVCCAVGKSKGTTVFYEIDHTAMSTSSKDMAELHAAKGHRIVERSVDVMTLTEVCALYADKSIHFLKIDVEGAERDVLEGADFHNFRPWIVLLEATEPNSPTPNHHSWDPLLIGAGYEFVWFDGLNRFYVASERMADLAQHFQVPPNVFDDFVLSRHDADSEKKPLIPIEMDLDYAQHTVSALYRGILLRDPDPEGLKNFSNIIADNGDILAVLRCLMTSEEFKKNLQQFFRRYNISLRTYGDSADVDYKEPSSL